jgi:photosystem II stability/assembly factor-like uncharacterized protein
LVGYAAGNSGTVVKTIDGGANWTPLTSGTTQNLRGLFFTSIDTGYVVGYNGIMLKTVNGGASWTPLTSGVNNMIFSIQFLTPTLGYATATVGIILRTTNGGTSWTVLPGGISASLRRVFMVNSAVGYCVGDVGTILKTMNGGFSNAGVAENESDNWLNISPNPNNGIFQISDFKFQILNVKIYNVVGECVFLREESFGQSTINNQQLSIDISGFTKGVYFVTITDENKNRINKKIVIN